MFLFIRCELLIGKLSVVILGAIFIIMLRVIMQSAILIVMHSVIFICIMVDVTYDKRHYGECHITIMLNVIILSVIIIVKLVSLC